MDSLFICLFIYLFIYLYVYLFVDLLFAIVHVTEHKSCLQNFAKNNEPSYLCISRY